MRGKEEEGGQEEEVGPHDGEERLQPLVAERISTEGGEALSGEEKGREEEEEVARCDGGEGVQPLPAAPRSAEGGEALAGEEESGQEKDVGPLGPGTSTWP